MSYRSAKIQYTVKFEEIPKEVNKRLIPLVRELELKSAELDSIISDISTDNIIKSIKDIDQFRRQMIFVDSVLEDSYNTLLSYNSYMQKLLDEENNKRQPAASGEKNENSEQV